jgi:hypothetical protein
MKSRSWIVVLVVVVLVLFWIFWPHRIQPVRVAEEKAVIPAAQKQIVANVPQSSTAVVSGAGQSQAQVNLQKVKQEPGAFEKLVEARNKPIDFYGQTVDQDGNPLPGVQIKIMVAYLTLDGRSIPADRTSDSNGLFDVHDVTGDGIDIEHMTKEGYTLEPMSTSFGPVGGAPGNPVIFKLWRNDIKEPLITGQKAFPIEPNGTSYVINFSKGTISLSGAENGDLEFRINMLPPIDGKYPHWSCEFQPVNGGLAEETDISSAMYLAPTSGYTNLFSFAISPANPWTRQSGTLRFYLRLKDGEEYGRVLIDMAAWARKTNILRVEYAINPTGSRILR